MVGGVGPAVVFDQRASRLPAATNATSGTTVMSVNASGQSLRVALPPARAQAERVIPIEVDGGRIVYNLQSAVAESKSAGIAPDSVQSTAASMARVTLNEKVIPSKPQMVPPQSTLSGSIVDPKSPSSASINTTNATDNKPSESYQIPKLRRGFSNILENESLVSEARSSVLQDIVEDSHHHMYIQSFVLPDLTKHTEDFRAFLEKELIETSTLISLEQAGRLNWWAELGLCQRLMPLATTGDGNCLLHAASLAMWGIHDRQLILRKALYMQLTESHVKDNLYRRWRWQQTNVNKQSGLVFSESEWKAEWENVLRLSSPSPRGLPDTSVTNYHSCCDSPVTNSSTSVSSDPVVYESLEEFHVFVLAHVLQRPIIVVADTVLKDANGDDLAPIPFGGIYLPLECESGDCYESPLLLTYDAAHFSALVPMKHADSQESLMPLAIPVVDPELKLLPLHFCYDPGRSFDWSCPSNKQPAEPSHEDRLNLLKRHMDIMQVPLIFGQNYCSDTPPVISTGPPSRQSSSGSNGSDESGQLVQNVNILPAQKDKKKEGKQNVVAKQFGSLGKSVGKKLKNIGNNLASSKGGSKAEVDKARKTSLSGGLTQSTKVITALATTGDAEHMVLCAQLLSQHSEVQEEMVNNYMEDARDRFIKDRELKRLKGEELRTRVALYPAAAAASRNRICASMGCKFYAGLDNDLCSNCVRDRQRAYPYQQPQSRGQFVYNTFPGRHKVPPSPSTGGPPSGSDEIYRFGKSKFYTSPDNNPGSPGLNPTAHATASTAYSGTLNKGTTMPHAMDRQQSLSTGNVAAAGRSSPAPRPRSPTPDYDNVEYAQQMKAREPRAVAPTFGGENPKCRTPGCDFYGSKDKDGLCSGCYKNRQQKAHLAKPEKTTKL